MPNIYNLFKFLEKKKGTKVPLKVKLIYTPNEITDEELNVEGCLLYTSPSPRDRQKSRMPSSA